jgi:hypothetical protein
VTEEQQQPTEQRSPDGIHSPLREWLRERRESISAGPPTDEEEAQVSRQLAPPEAQEALALWRMLHVVLDQGLDLFTDDAVAQSLLDEIGCHLKTKDAPELLRGFIAPEGGARVTPEAFAARLQREPPTGLELPDGVTLTGASLAAFVESGHFPYGRYRVSEERYFVTPSLRLGAATLETLVRSGLGQQRVGGDLLVWRPASFQIAAGTASEVRAARPFVGPSGARAYVWLGRPLPGGPLVIRDANEVTERIAVPEGDGSRNSLEGSPNRRNTETRRHGEQGQATVERATERTRRSHPVPPSPRPPLRHSHPALQRAEEVLQSGDPAAAERCLREVMASPSASGEALARAGQLWQRLGRQEVASAAYQMALERGCVEGALGLSRLAEAAGEGVAAAARPLDAAVARNLRSPELHVRYAELLVRIGHGRQSEWHRRQADDLLQVRSEE